MYRTSSEQHRVRGIRDALGRDQVTGGHILIVPEGFCLRLRSADENDLENLRTWRNLHRERFFHSAYITAAEQRRWYERFARLRDSFMFIVEATCSSPPKPFGCMGFRLRGDVLDVYNVIRGARTRGQRCTMGEALALMCSYGSRFGRPITCKVLKDNPAVKWYERNAFRIVNESRSYYLMRLSPDAFVPVRYSAEEIA
jgi:ribosomal protein S18 acetylase RimI-like enzyme